jgi:MarR family transcriptional regulator, 2-MHQ and catechol-resistance regulon repressor
MGTRHDDPLDSADITAVGLLAEVFRALDSRLGRQVAEHGLGAVEFEVLLRLGRSPGQLLRMTDLSAQTSLTTSGVTRVVDRLVERGLVQREACASDRRTTYAVATDDGMAALREVLPGHVDLVRTTLTGPLGGAGRLDDFIGSLRLLRDQLVPGATAGSDPLAIPAPR